MEITKGTGLLNKGGAQRVPFKLNNNAGQTESKPAEATQVNDRTNKYRTSCIVC